MDKMIGTSRMGQESIAGCASAGYNDKQLRATPAQSDSEIGQQRKRCAVALEMMDEAMNLLERRLRPVLQSFGESANKTCGESPTPNLSEIAAEFYGIAGRTQEMAARVRALLDALALD